MSVEDAYSYARKVYEQTHAINQYNLTSEEWYQYFKEQYSAENVEGSAYNWSAEELQRAVDSIHATTYNGQPGGKMTSLGSQNPITISPDEKVFLSKNNQKPPDVSINKAIEIFGAANVEVVKGYKKNYTKYIQDLKLQKHSEVRGIKITKNTYGTAEGYKQFCSHYSCDSCGDIQRKEGVMNYTGYEVDHGTRTRRYSDILY